MKCLATTKFVNFKDAIFFIEENIGVFGKLDPNCGKVKLYKNTPKEILGKSAYDIVFFTRNDRLYIVCQNGVRVIEFDYYSEEFNTIISQDIFIDTQADWAGVVNCNNNSYLFSRDDGMYFQYDFDKNELNKKNTGIKDKICWCCSNGETIYSVNWNLNKIYIYDLKQETYKIINVDLHKIVNITSRTPIPLHNMIYNGGYLYFLCAKYIFRMKIETRNIEIIYENRLEDNGARIVIIDKNIIIPPYSGDAIVVLNQNNFTDNIHIKIPDSKVEDYNHSKDSKVGVPCIKGSKIIFPLILHNGFIICDLFDNKLDFIEYTFDEIATSETMREIMNKNVVVEDGVLFMLDELINML